MSSSSNFAQRSTEARSNTSVEHIAAFLPFLGGGGAERAVANLFSEFARQGICTEIVVTNLGRSNYVDSLHPEVEVIELKASKTWFGLGQLTRYLQQEQPDVLLSVQPNTHPLIFLARLWAGSQTRCAASVQNYHSHELVGGQDVGWMKRIFVKLLPVVIPRMDHVVAISKVVKRDLVENFDIDASLIQVAYNPVVSDAVLEKQAESVDHPWFENRESPIAISVGRLTEQKNYPLLFRAFAQVRQKRPLRLIVLGEGEQRESLKHLASELGIEEDVSMPGFVENPYPYMREADLFLLSSKWEGLPNVLVEALATNCQIVSTDCPGGPKEVLQEGRYGRLVPIGDVSAYASAIDQALNEEPPDGLQLRQRWSDFTAETVAQDYLRIFEGQKPERN